MERYDIYMHKISGQIIELRNKRNYSWEILFSSFNDVTILEFKDTSETVTLPCVTEALGVMHVVTIKNDFVKIGRL